MIISNIKRSQAVLQHRKTATSENKYKIIPFLPDKGLTRMLIYYYNHYETTALKRLTCRYTVCKK